MSGQIVSYDVVNARITWSDIALGETALYRSQHGDGIFLMTWGRNIFDEEYRENTIPFGLWTISYWGAPATYGLDARVSF